MKPLLLICLISLFACTVQNNEVPNRQVETNLKYCDSISILGRLINEIIRNPEIIGYSRNYRQGRSLFLPTGFILIEGKININNSLQLKYYDDIKSISVLRGGDIILKDIEFRDNFSKINPTALFINDKGHESIRSKFQYNVNLEDCLLKLEDSEYWIID